MATRYVRVCTPEGKIHYGILQINRTVKVLDAPPWLQGQPTELELEPDRYRLLAPCSPSKVVAIGKNYVAHATEMGSVVPPEPLLFLKPPSAIVANGDPILYPPQSHRVDYEGELALVIGDRCTDCTPEEAAHKIWGYTIANDVTARDLQKASLGPWARAKGFDSFCPWGLGWFGSCPREPHCKPFSTTTPQLSSRRRLTKWSTRQMSWFPTSVRS